MWIHVANPAEDGIPSNRRYIGTHYWGISIPCKGGSIPTQYITKCKEQESNSLQAIEVHGNRRGLEIKHESCMREKIEN